MSCFGIKGFKYLSCFGIKCKRFKYFPPSTNNMDRETNPDLQDLQKYDLWEGRKGEAIKHTNIDIEQKEFHDYLPRVYSEVKTRGGVFHFYVNCIEFYVNWMQMVETRSALMQD